MKTESVSRAFGRAMAEFGLNPDGPPVAVSVSGGLDSMVLLHLFFAGCFRQVHVFHLNHGFRPDAAADEVFVAQAAASWNFPCHVYRRDVPAYAEAEGMSKQLAARTVRRRLLLECAADHGCEYVVTGHHLDDQAETVLMRILRGTGISGLGGMAPRQGRFLRPLLAVTKAELAAYCGEHGILYREDPSNRGRDYFRNRVRHDILPVLQRESPDVVVHLNRLAAAARADNEYLEQQTAALSERLLTEEGGEWILNRSELQKLHRALQRRLLRELLFRAQGHRRRITFEHIEALRSLIFAGGSFSLDLPSLQVRGETNTIAAALQPRPERTHSSDLLHKAGVSVPLLPSPRRSFGQLREVTVSLAALRSGPRLFTTPLGIVEMAVAAPDDGGQRRDDGTDIHGLNDQKTERTELFDGRQLALPLRIRARRPGDAMSCFGSQTWKKVNRLMIDAKIPRCFRDCLPLICDSEDILWIPGVRRCSKAPVTAAAEEIVRFSFRPQPDAGMWLD